MMLNLHDTASGVNDFPGATSANPGSADQTNKPEKGSSQPHKILNVFGSRAVETAIECGYSPIPGKWKPGRAKMLGPDKKPLLNARGKEIWKDREASDAKRPLLKGWQEHSSRVMTPDEIAAARKPAKKGQEHLPQIHLAMGFNNVIAIDVDTNDPFIQKIVLDVIGRSPVSRVGSKGYADFFLVEGPMPKSEKWNGKDLGPKGEKYPVVEIMADRTNVRIPPSYHPTAPGNIYRWVDDNHKIYNTCFDELPRITAEKIALLKERLTPFLLKEKVKPVEPRKTRKVETVTEQLEKRYKALAEKQLNELAAELDGMGKGGRNDRLFRGVCRIGVFVHKGMLTETSLYAALEAAMTNNGFVKEEPGGIDQVQRTIGDGLDRSEKDELPELPDRPLDSGTGFGGWSQAVEDEIDEANSPENVAAYARAYAEEKARAGTEQPQAEGKGADTSPPGDSPPPEDEFSMQYSDEGMALHFAQKYRNRLRFVKPWHSWMNWTGQVWEKEDTLLAYDLIRKECRVAAAIAIQNPDRKQGMADAGYLSCAKARGAIERLSQSDRRLAAKTSQWDADDWIINTPGGVIDLRTGKNIGHDPARFCTKITDVTPHGDCALWLKFLDRVTKGDKELQAYLQRMCGYFLTGSVREHALFFIYGPGGNGKGVFLNTVSAILAAYHVVSPAATFAEQKNQRHETEIARLDGARLVISQETQQGTYWDEAKIKALTGGDKLAGRFMRGDFFEFDPRFKLCIVGNHKPQLRTVDDGVRRRFQLIPFDVAIPEEEKDRELPSKLKAEYGGIMAWMVEGCRKWQEEGLSPPECVLAATEEYLSSEDSIGSWLSDMCVTPKSYAGKGEEERRAAAKVEKVTAHETTLADLFKSWKEYADATHTAARNNKYLADQLTQRGFKRGRDRRGAFLTGLRLKDHTELVLDGIRTGTPSDNWNREYGR